MRDMKEFSKNKARGVGESIDYFSMVCELIEKVFPFIETKFGTLKKIFSNDYRRLLLFETPFDRRQTNEWVNEFNDEDESVFFI